MNRSNGSLPRRRLLQMAAVGSLAVAGCLDQAGELADQADEQPPEQASVDSETITTTERGCGNADDETTTVTRTETGVTVEGAAWAPTPCNEATLQTLLEGTTLNVVIGIEAEAPGEPCIECIGRIEYLADIELSADAVVETVTVEHVASEFSDTTQLE